MSLYEKFGQDIISAMKNQEKSRLTTLRMVKGAMQLENINNKKELNDELFVEVISKQIKMRNESLNEFKKANRLDLVSNIEEELSILQEYLPKQLSKEEIEKIIDEAFIIVKPNSNKDMGSIMREVTPKVKGKADMSLVSSLIKEKLNNI